MLRPRPCESFSLDVGGWCSSRSFAAFTGSDDGGDDDGDNDDGDDDDDDGGGGDDDDGVIIKDVFSHC